MIWVANKTKFIIQQALFNFAQQLQQPASKVQLVITTYDPQDKMPAFRVLVNGNPAKIDHGDGSADEHVTFLEILGVPIDFMNYQEAAMPFLAEALDRFSKELQCPADHINVVMFSDDTLKVFVDEKPGKPKDEWETVATGPLHLQLYKLIPAHTLKEEGQPDQHVPDKKKFIRHMNIYSDIFGIDESDV